MISIITRNQLLVSPVDVEESLDILVGKKREVGIGLEKYFM